MVNSTSCLSVSFHTCKMRFLLRPVVLCLLFHPHIPRVNRKQCIAYVNLFSQFVFMKDQRSAWVLIRFVIAHSRSNQAHSSSNLGSKVPPKIDFGVTELQLETGICECPAVTLGRSHSPLDLLLCKEEIVTTVTPRECSEPCVRDQHASRH